MIRSENSTKKLKLRSLGVEDTGVCNNYSATRQTFAHEDRFATQYRISPRGFLMVAMVEFENCSHSYMLSSSLSLIEVKGVMSSI